MDERLVTVIVSDPWSFPDENEGRIAFVARIAGSANRDWLLEFQGPIIYEGCRWRYAIPTPRLVGQGRFDQPGRNNAANILFISDDQAKDEQWLANFDRHMKPTTPWVIGSVEMGITQIIPEGADSYVEPRWKPRSD